MVYQDFQGPELLFWLFLTRLDLHALSTLRAPHIATRPQN